MDDFRDVNGELHCEGVRLRAIAGSVGTLTDVDPRESMP